MSKIQLISSYTNGKNWYRGNLHTHTTRSDGSRSPELVIADYESRGYDFLGISDHDILVDPSEFQSQTKMTLIPAVEVTARGPHTQQINATNRVEPNQDRQIVINEIIDDGGLCVLNHPNWQSHFNHYDLDLMKNLDGYHGIEIYNGVIERQTGSATATDKWDQLLADGKKIWGFGNDDSHAPQDVEIAWNVVRADHCTVSEITESLRNGNFYASTGVTIEEIEINDLTISVRSKEAQRIRFISKSGFIQKTIDDRDGSFTVPVDQAKRLNYIRIECYGAGGRIAWTQPIFIETE